jgi:hypothetical protein
MGVPAGLVPPDALRDLQHGGYTTTTFVALARALRATLGRVEENAAGLDPRRLGLVRTRLGALAQFYDHLATTDGPHNATGARVVAVALSNVGEVVSSAKGGVDAETGRPTRQGYERLEEIFAASRNSGSGFNVNDPDTVKYLDTGKQGNGNTTGLASWCGIFANYALRKAGVDGGIFSLERRAPNARVPPGSVLSCVKYQHYAIVLMDLGDVVVTIDGNTGGLGAIGVGNRRRKEGPIRDERGKAVEGLYGFFALPSAG